ncbi:uncharacterized protein LTR77_005368 [Saxophila tyrrhenica]|uniref:Hypervirulence associated protein TUDOR domain-containing protein n=1 Tax=Saxophila tyrrhenica TaxID=1690608 RepID=A0AAV9P8Q3_9PEZI|nr:hypothetical protein LTR77_005368 [Saxophila tyrrhenica]
MEPIYPPLTPPLSNGNSNGVAFPSHPRDNDPLRVDDDPGKEAPALAPVHSQQLPASCSTPTSLLKPPHLLYSPTQREIDSHPIRQRLSLSRDPVCSGLGTALLTHQTYARVTESEEADLRQAEEGSKQELPDDNMSDNNNVEKGDEVSYQWSGGRPGGTVTDKATEGAVTMETKRGNEVKKGGDEENPALYISRDEGHDVVKKASEVDIEEKGDGDKGGDEKEEGAEEEEKEENGDAKTGEKRSAEETSEEKKDEEEGESKANKKQKTSAEPKANGEQQPKKKGRPAKNANGGGAGGAKKETKKKEPKKAATETGEPRRSGRNRS